MSSSKQSHKPPAGENNAFKSPTTINAPMKQQSEKPSNELEELKRLGGRQLINLHEFGSAARRTLLHRLVDVHIGGFVVRDVSKRALMAVSPEALNHFKDSAAPALKVLVLPAAIASIESITHIREWLKKTCKTTKAFAFPVP